MILFNIFSNILMGYINETAIFKYGPEYTLKSDDLSYVLSGIQYLKTGKITMHGVISAQIMPGMTFLIAFFAFLFGEGEMLWLVLKIFWMLMGIVTIYTVYKTIKLFTNKFIAALPCLMFLCMDYIWMDNLILTETPFILLFALLIYHTFKLSITKSKKDYILLILYYIIAVFIRPNIGIYPIFMAAYLLIKKYNPILLFKQLVIMGAVLIVTLTPWIIRNYNIFGKFIPLTYGMGNPLLLGTYQGVGYPLDEELDYKTNVDDKMPEEMRYYVENSDEKPYMTKYYRLEYDGMKAKYRMEEWWKRNPKSMIKSYCYFKPIILIHNTFYWDTFFRIKGSWLMLIRKYEIILTVICGIIALFNKERFKEILLLGSLYISQIALYSYSFAFDRYGMSLIFIRYIIIGIGLEIIYENIKNIFKSRKLSVKTLKEKF